jgi:hypothetical protein
MYDNQIRFILNKGKSPNQPVSHFLANEWFRVKKTLNEPLECSICLNDIDCKNCICLLMCGHAYHIGCIHQQTFCPLCRQ